MALKEKMQQLRESVPQAGKEATRDAPSTYRINAINPAQNIEDQWAYIDTPYNYGSRGPHQGVRKIRVGDELPQGSVVSITAEGIQVLPDFEGSEEYVIPMGGSSYEPPPGEKTEPEAPTVKELIEKEKGRRDWEAASEHYTEQTQDALADAGDYERVGTSSDGKPIYRAPSTIDTLGLGADTISSFYNFNRTAKRQRIGEAIEDVQGLKTFDIPEEIDFDWPEEIDVDWPEEPFDEEAIRRAAESL
jgi:hypothetical protein